ncbi:MAG: hypothetical protein BWY29_00859 [Microgenomates group bacterium ADurb.Bin238]|nr:MAG: hypothetical protein BWY29_00859 [Microgenomates group bacterium ADurb.Bin238]
MQVQEEEEEEVVVVHMALAIFRGCISALVQAVEELYGVMLRVVMVEQEGESYT